MSGPVIRASDARATAGNTRRAFLRGAGVAGITGIAACTGPAPMDSRAAGSSRSVIETSGRLDSRYTGARMGWTIAVPGKSRPRAIVYCLHAKGADHRMAFDSIRVPEVALRINLPLAVAAVDGGKDSYWHRRSDGSDALAMLLREFVPLVRARVGSLPEALMGWSTGGYGALLAAERAASRFIAVSPASPALWLTPGATAPGAFDSPADFYANDVFTGVGRLRPLSVAVFCGTADPFYRATRHLVSLMRFRHIARFGPGGHDATYWRNVAPGQVESIGRALRLRAAAGGGDARDLGFCPSCRHDAREFGQCAGAMAQPRGVER